MSATEIDLVTGASGFIGRQLAMRLLRDGRRVRALCRPGSEAKLPSGVEAVTGDLTDRESLFHAARDVARVFHCAAHVSDWGTEQEFQSLNVRGARWMCEAAKAGGARRLVHLSSIAAFGTPSPSEFDDSSSYGRSRDGYSRTKAEGERAVFAFAAEENFPVAVLRPAVVYGPGSAWLDEPLRMMRKGQMFLLGGGKGTCHPCYVENLIDAMLLAAVHPRAVGQGFIVADDDPISFREYFNAVSHLGGYGDIRRSFPLPFARVLATGCELTARVTRSRSRPMLTHTAIAMVCTKSRMSMRKIRDELGFVPRFSFQAAMREIREAGVTGSR